MKFTKATQVNTKDSRIAFIFIFFGIFITFLLIRLFYWQIVKGEELKDKAQTQYNKNITIAASRGNILANDETWLAAKTKMYELSASLSDISEDKEFIANKLTKILIAEGKENIDYKTDFIAMEDRLVRLLTKHEGNWITLSKKVTEDQKIEIEDASFSGLHFDDYEARFYPEGSKAAQLLGFVGKDSSGVDTGYFGLEGYYDAVLKGRPGYEERQTDVRGIPFLFEESRKVDEYHGVDLVTSIDKGIQIKAENKLKSGIEKYGATSGSLIVMEPRSGAILAMAAFPSFDPATYSDFESEDFRNPLISNSFEPGSVFKVIAMAAALDANVISPDTLCDICNGPVKIGKYYINTWDNIYRANSTMTDVIVHSDNTGMTFIGFKLGQERFFDYITAFGFGKKTGIDLQGEMSPALRRKGSWSEIDLATATFGQGIAITPIQLIAAVSAIANDGILVKPHVVRKLKVDGWEESIQFEEGKRVISKKAADEITAMMAEAAKNGESKWTNLPGFKVAGKTGTAQIPIQGHYDEDKTIASFVGFAPYDNPRFVMLLTLREPQTSQWASETAAPLWYSIARDLFYYYGIHPEN